VAVKDPRGVGAKSVLHGWRLLGNSNRDIHAENEIWEFFQSAP
jgi:hypothetical protein